MTTNTVPETKKPKKYPKIIGWILAGLLVLFLLFNYFPVEKQATHPFFKKGEAPLVIAHQGGELLAPSNTLTSFQQAVDMGVDVLEYDIHISKDGHLVAIHDPTVDRTTDGTGQVAELTLEEIQTLDAGYHFQDLNGANSYRGKGVYIPTVEEVFQAFPTMRMVIEIKDDNPPERIDEIADNLWKLIQKHQMEDRVLVVAFDQEIVDTFENISNGRTAVAGGRQEIKKFVIFHTIFARNLYRPKVDAFQIPIEDSGIDLTKKSLIEGAHRRGVDVHYWTIDDKETMERLIKQGADGIITNRPDLMIELLEEMGY